MIGGRRWWLAWPVGIVCAGVVAGMVYLAVPAVPWVTSYTIEMLQQGARTRTDPPPTAKPLTRIGTALTDDCATLYPSALWLELAFEPHTVLSQDMTPPDSELMTAMAPWHPEPRMTCGWRAPSGGTVRTSLVDLTLAADATQPVEDSTGSGDAAQQAIAAALAKLGFGCRLSGADAALLTCTRRSGPVADTEVIDGRVWLSTREAGWHPPGYVPALVDRLWPQSTR